MDYILCQDTEYSYEIIADQLQSKTIVSKKNREVNAREADVIYCLLPDSLQRAVDLNKEKGASVWLTALPLSDHGFALHKSAFYDALALRYGWTPLKLTYKCECGNGMSVEQALACAKEASHNKA